MSYVIGVDGCTESLRAFVFDLDGPARFSRHGIQDRFPEAVLGGARSGRLVAGAWRFVKGALAKANIAAQDVIALCVDTTCCSVVTLERDGRPLRPAMIWMDMRSARQADA